MEDLSVSLDLFKMFIRCFDRMPSGLDWFVENTTLANESPLVILCHGLCGDSQSSYIQYSAREFIRNGFHVVSFVARGCGGIPLTTPEGFTAARYTDLEFCLREIKSRFPTRSICCVGYSLGAGILLNYLGRTGKDSLITAAVAVSPSWDFLRETPVFEWWSRYYLIGNVLNDIVT